MRRIESMSREEKVAMSERAIETAYSLTDYKAAEMYINDIEERMKR